MQRYNIFHPVHQSLRAQLYHTAIFLDHTNFRLEGEALNAGDKVAETVHLLEEHNLQLDHFLRETINDYEPSVVDTFQQEQRKCAHLLQQLCIRTGNLSGCRDNRERFRAGAELNRSFVALTLFCLTLMERKESGLNRVLWRYYSDAELEVMQQMMALHRAEPGGRTQPWKHVA